MYWESRNWLAQSLIIESVICFVEKAMVCAGALPASILVEVARQCTMMNRLQDTHAPFSSITIYLIRFRHVTTTIPLLPHHPLSLTFAMPRQWVKPPLSHVPNLSGSHFPPPPHIFDLLTAVTHLLPIDEGCKGSGWGLDEWVGWSSGIIRGGGAQRLQAIPWGFVYQ